MSFYKESSSCGSIMSSARWHSTKLVDDSK
jgi:hypothetical protein